MAEFSHAPCVEARGVPAKNRFVMPEPTAGLRTAVVIVIGQPSGVAVGRCEHGAAFYDQTLGVESAGKRPTADPDAPFVVNAREERLGP